MRGAGSGLRLDRVVAGPRHFLGLDELDAQTLRSLLDEAVLIKRDRKRHDGPGPLAGRELAMIFEKESTRTRVSFAVAMHRLGGETIVLAPEEMQLGRGETIEDTARVLSRYVDAIMIRTDSHDKLLQLAEHAGVPVINGLTDRTHPCQLMADIMTFEEHRGAIAGREVAWVGDGNNVAATWLQAAARFGFALRMACPAALRPDPEIAAWAEANGARVSVTEDMESAVRGADCVVTDSWISLSDDPDTKVVDLLRPYQVDERIMALAGADALFMHCLPAKRGQEVVDAVIDGRQSVVWDEAENRVHAQQAILLWCMAPPSV